MQNWIKGMIVKVRGSWVKAVTDKLKGNWVKAIIDKSCKTGSRLSLIHI